ncbi:hypothetical protein IFM89_035260, partial [Coptis chinensis]
NKTSLFVKHPKKKTHNVFVRRLITTLNLKVNTNINSKSIKWSKIRCSSLKRNRKYNITLLPGDGIGPEVIPVAKKVLTLATSQQGIEFEFKEMPVGGAALDLVGVPLPD